LRFLGLSPRSGANKRSDGFGTRLGIIKPPILETVQIRLDGGLATVVLSGAQSSNSIDEAMIRDLVTAFAWLADRAPAAATIIEGAEGNFCAGYDEEWWRDVSSSGRANVGLVIQSLNRVFVEMRRIPAPTVAAVAGRAAGPGLSIALACDSRVVAREAKLDFRFDADLVLPPHAALTYFLPRIVPPARALELLLDGESVTGEEAAEIGLAAASVPQSELFGEVRRHSRTLVDQTSEVVSLRQQLEPFRYSTS
jgi:2-(1,2-epoxy-1,2-dihydrophenyl)acetyl-CoA isomerase